MFFWSKILSKCPVNYTMNIKIETKRRGFNTNTNNKLIEIK